MSEIQIKILLWLSESWSPCSLNKWKPCLFCGWKETLSFSLEFNQIQLFSETVMLHWAVTDFFSGYFYYRQTDMSNFPLNSESLCRDKKSELNWKSTKNILKHKPLDDEQQGATKDLLIVLFWDIVWSWILERKKKIKSC